MDPINLLRAFFKSEPTIQPQNNGTDLKPGQIVSGKILKTYPNHFAEVLVGSEKLLAKLEVALSAGEQYRFQVLSVEGKIHLKMLKANSPGPSSGLDTNTADQVMNQSMPIDHSIAQFVTQVPIQLGERPVEMTIQWNGRKKADGKIDPNECRILFYLELANLGETLVDLQIQNRILSISVVNGTPNIKELAGSFIAPLKEKLQLLQYQLKTVTFAKPTKLPLKARINRGLQPVKKEQAYPGVDIRI